MDIKAHDEILGATSHLPHILAYLLVDMLDSDLSVDAERLQDMLDHTDRYNDSEKREILEKQREQEIQAGEK